MKTTILCDFDGTIIPNEVPEELVISHGGPEYYQLIAQWDEGEVNTPDVLQMLFSGMGATSGEFNRYFDGISVDPTFPPFLDFCRKMGYDFHVVSDGFLWYIERILNRHGLMPISIFTSVVTFDGTEFHLSYPWRNEDCEPCNGVCGTCKRDIVLNFKKEGARVIFIGNSFEDRYGAMESDLVFAKARLREQLQAIGYPFTPFRDFNDIIAALQREKA